MNENIEEEINLNLTHISIQTLRFISPQTGNLGNNLTRCQKRHIEQRINCTMIYLCRNEEKLFHVLINHKWNKRIFHRDLLLRDNRKVTCGTYLCLLAPYPVERLMRKTTYLAIIMEVPSQVSEIIIDNYIQGYQTPVTVLKSATLKLTRTTPIQTTCTVPYAEIGASFDNSRFGLLLWGGCFVCCFEFGCIQNIVSRW